MWLIALVVVVCIAAILWLEPGSNGRSGIARSVLVYQEGRLVKKLDITGYARESLPGNHMEIEVDHGRVRVVRSDCAKQICVHTGWISLPGEVIVCVPNKTLLEIPGNETSFLDAVVR